MAPHRAAIHAEPRLIRRRPAAHVCTVDGFDPQHGAISPLAVEQCRQALVNGAASLSERGLSIGDVTRVVYVVREADALSSCFPLLRDVFGDTRPGVTMRLVPGFAHPEMQIELELVASGA